MRNRIKEVFGNKKLVFLIAVFSVSVISCMYSSMTYGRTVLNSDSAVYNTFVDAVWKHHSLFPKTWNYANGEVWSVDNPLVFINIFIQPFVELSDYSRAIASALLPIITSIIFIVFYRRALKSDAWVIALPIAFLFLFGVHLYLLYDACYVTYYIWEPITIYCLINIWKRRNDKLINKYSASLVIVFSVISIHGLRIIADYIVPAVLTLFFFLYLEYNDNVNLSIKKGIERAVCFGLINVIPMVVGIGMYKHISETRNINDTMSGFMVFPETLNDLGEAFHRTITLYFRCFGFIPNAEIISINGIRNFISIIFVLLICLIIPILQLKRIDEENEDVKVFVAYVFIHNSILFLFSVVCNYIINYYHMIPSIILFILLSSRFLYKYCIIDGGRVRSIIWIMSFTIAVLVECIGLVKLSYNWKDVLNDRKYLANSLVEKGLTKGYATFWNAYATQMYTGNKVKMSAIGLDERAFAEYWWLNDSEDYNCQDSQTFIMLTGEEKENASNIDLLIRSYEEPIDEFVLENVSLYHQKKGYFRDDVYVYVYKDDYSKYMVNGSDDGIIVPREMMFNDLGVRAEEAIYVSKDGLVYGPYSTLKSGDYQVEYHGKGLSNSIVQIMSEKDDNGIISYSVESISDDCIRIKLFIKSRIEAVQFRLNNPTEKEVIVTDVSVIRE